MTVLIGNSPSSGSTLLADLLDSLPHAACGPELSMFANKYIYDFPFYRKNVFRAAVPCSIYKKHSRTYYHNLPAYGRKKWLYRNYVRRFNNIHDFTADFRSNFMKARGKSEDAVWFEKSPENINCVKEFLESFPNGYFIHIVRDPFYVFRSLCKRDFPKQIAATTWLFDVVQLEALENHPRLLTLTYEELVQNPFEAVSKVMTFIGKDIQLSEEELLKAYSENSFREGFSRVESWQVQSLGEVKSANMKKTGDDELLAYLNSFGNVKIDQHYADLFNVSTIPYKELAAKYDYKVDGRIDDVKMNQDTLDFLQMKAVHAVSESFIEGSLAQIFSKPFAI